MSDSNFDLVRRSYRGAITNPDTHDLFGRFETLCRWDEDVRSVLPELAS
jgi:hypothetical protein